MRQIGFNAHVSSQELDLQRHDSFADPDHGEERAEGEGRFEGAEPEEEGEDEPGEDLFALLVLVVGCGVGVLDGY